MEQNCELRNLKKLFGTIYFVQGASGLPKLSLLFYLKNVLHMDEATGQFFSGFTSLAWFIKPLWGWISDTFPICGYRRKSWIVIMAALGFLFWQLIAFSIYAAVPALLIYIILFNLAASSYAFVDVAGDAAMVEKGQEYGRIADLTIFQWKMLAVSSMLVAVFGGWFQTKIQQGEFAYWMIFSLTGFFSLLTVYVALRYVHEEKMPRRAKQCSRFNGMDTKAMAIAWAKGVVGLLRKGADFIVSLWQNDRYLVYLIFFLIAWHFSPSIGYAFRMYAIDELGFTPAIMGIQDGVGAVIYFLSIVGFYWLIRRFANVRWHTILYGMIALGAVRLALEYYYYLPPVHPLSVTLPFPWWPRVISAVSPLADFGKSNWLFWIAWPYDAVSALSEWNRYHWWSVSVGSLLFLVSIPASLIPLILAGQIIKKEQVAMMYALLMSVVNAANSLEDIAGGILYTLFSSWVGMPIVALFESSLFNFSAAHNERLLILQMFVYISVFFTALGIPFIMLLKRELKRKGIEISLASRD
ncbi:MAG: hypothetical protein U1A23_01580 [Candidatus Sungbacteria bacterium]|nr:hypothetical protein [bacterium]MDZ4285597.1 hypothetical protein [Candidatus Sungbacteria bacterium]